MLLVQELKLFLAPFISVPSDIIFSLCFTSTVMRWGKKRTVSWGKEQPLSQVWADWSKGPRIFSLSWWWMGRAGEVVRENSSSYMKDLKTKEYKSIIIRSIFVKGQVIRLWHFFLLSWTTECLDLAPWSAPCLVLSFLGAEYGRCKQWLWWVFQLLAL